MSGGAICKGAWALRSNCGTCSRCLESAPEYIAQLRDQLERAEQRIFNAVNILPPEPMRVGANIVRFEPPQPVDLIYAVRKALLP